MTLIPLQRLQHRLLDREGSANWWVDRIIFNSACLSIVLRTEQENQVFPEISVLVKKYIRGLV